MSFMEGTHGGDENDARVAAKTPQGVDGARDFHQECIALPPNRGGLQVAVSRLGGLDNAGGLSEDPEVW